MDSDEKLIAKYLRTMDRKDLNRVVARHVGPIHGLAFKMTSDQALADDITQDVFLKVVGAVGKFKGQSTFATWLYRIAMNTTYSALKRRKRQNDHVSATPMEFEATKDCRPEEGIMQTEMIGEFDRQIQKLKPEFRAAIVLTAYQKLSPSEAATVEGCTPQTFYWRLHEARKQLKQRLTGYLQS